MPPLPQSMVSLAPQGLPENPEARSVLVWEGECRNCCETFVVGGSEQHRQQGLVALGGVYGCESVRATSRLWKAAHLGPELLQLPLMRLLLEERLLVWRLLGR